MGGKEPPGRALMVPPEILPKRPGTSKSRELLERARAALEVRAPARAIPVPAPASEEWVLVPMTCGATGSAFTAVAERRGNHLLLMGPELSGRPGVSAATSMLSDAYRLDMVSGWTCPHCGSTDQVWSCRCAEFRGALHCGGTTGRARFCACGRLEERTLIVEERLDVRGSSVASAPRRMESRLPMLGGDHKPGGRDR
jgi:hypothetical protein